MLVYSLVFSTLMRFNVSGTKYPVFILSGLLAWNFFTQAVSGSVNSVLGNASLVKKVAFPWVLLTLSSVVAAFINYLISLVLLVPMVLLFQVPLGWTLLALPILAVIMFALALGLSLLVAAGNVYFRDIEYLVTIALQVWFFATPIIYSLYGHVHRVDGRGRPIEDTTGILYRIDHSGNALAPVFKYVLYANPMTWIETAFQDVIAFHEWPEHWLQVGTVAVLSGLTLLFGLTVFNRLQGHFAEEL
jgi:ABC-type polysaccharide/polyol phosphate export permease